MERILAVDYGTKNIGLAISDTLGIAAHPLPSRAKKGDRSDIEHIINLVREYSVSVVVIGLPLLMDGTEGDLARQARNFGAEIKSAISPGEDVVQVEFYDERLTTSLVEKMLIEEADISRSRRKKIKDKLSAVVILQNYMDSLGHDK